MDGCARRKRRVRVNRCCAACREMTSRVPISGPGVSGLAAADDGRGEGVFGEIGLPVGLLDPVEDVGIGTGGDGDG